MKVTTKQPKSFTPIELTILIENEKDLKLLKDILSHANGYYKHTLFNKKNAINLINSISDVL